MRYKVYKIVNNINGKLYIGFTSESLHRRFTKHIGSFYRKEYTSKLFRAFSKYGVKNFNIKLVKSFDNKYTALNYEKYLIKKLNTQNLGYNITLGGEGTLGIKRSQKHINIVRASRIKAVIRSDGKYFKSITDAARKTKVYQANISKCIYGINGTCGGYTWKFSKNDPINFRNRNRKLAKIKQTLAKIKKDKTIFKAKKIKCLTNNKIYNSISDAGRDLNLNIQNISRACYNKGWTVKGYKFKFMEKNDGK